MLRRKCLHYLSKICGLQARIPTSLGVLPFYDRAGSPLYRSGYADIWRGEYCGRDVAVKTLRVHRTKDSDQIARVGCPRLTVCIDELIMSGKGVLQGGCDMEVPLSSECVATVRRDNDWESVRDGIGVDEEQEH